MRLTRTLDRLIHHVLVGMFLFAQLAVSAYACPDLLEPASPRADMQAEAVGAMPPGCDEIDEQAANLCAEHCKAGQQSHDTSPMPVVTAPVLALLYMLPGEASAVEGEDARTSSVDPLLAATPPPHAILHCVLRI